VVKALDKARADGLLFPEIHHKQINVRI